MPTRTPIRETLRRAAALALAAGLGLAGAARGATGDAETVVFHPHVDWEPVAGADRYRVQVARDAAFRSIVDDDSVHAVLRWYVVERRLGPADYFWRVRGETDGGAAFPWSPARRLRVLEPSRTFRVTPAMAVEEVSRVAADAARGPSARIVFEPGHYRWDPGFEGAVFRWEDAGDIVVEGNGAEIFLLDPSAQAFSLRRCHRIAIADLTFHHQPTPYSAIEVTEVEPSGDWFEGRVLAGFEEERYPRKVNQMFVYAVSPEGFDRKHPERPGHTYLEPDRTARVGEHSFRYFAREETERGSLRQLRRGDRALVCYRRWPLNWVFSCTDVTWSGIVGGLSEGALFMGGDNRDSKFLGIAAPMRDGFFPSAGGWVTGNERRGPWIEGCSWEGLTDDGPNITGNAFLIDAVDGPDSVVVSTGPAYQTPRWLPGDEIVFWDPARGALLRATRAVHASPAEGSRIRATLADPVPEVSPGRDLIRCTHVYNLSTQNREAAIRFNRIRGGRRFGFNVKAIGLLVEGNEFRDLASSAVYLENEPSGWEGLASRDVVVEGNRIFGCGFDAHSLRLRRASIHVNTWRTVPLLEEADWIGNRNLVIRRNTIADWEGIAIGIDNAEGVRISENRLGRGTKGRFLGAENCGIQVFAKTRDVTVERNDIDDPRPGYRPVVLPEGS